MILRLAALTVALVLSQSTFAQEEEEKGPWSAKATVGYLATTGNTENSTLNTGVEVGYATGSWTHLATGKAINATEDNSTTTEAYNFGWKSEWNLSDKSFIFGKLDYRKDRFSGFDNQFSQVVGYGHRLIMTDKHSLNAEVGAGARQSETQEGVEEDEVVFNGGLYYVWTFSETASFNQDLTTEVGPDNTYSESVSKVTARLIGNLALVASYTIKHNSDVPAGTEKKDTYSALSLEYVF